MLKQALTLLATLGVSITTTTRAGISPVSDNFDVNSQTFPNWVSVGSLATLIQYDSVSSSDYDLNDLVNSQANALDGDGVVGNLAGDTEPKGDGLLNDGGLRLNTQDTTPGNEAIGLTLAGTMSLWEQTTLTVHFYNENSSFWSGRIQLYDLTTSNVLAETSGTVLANGTTNYVPASLTVSYIANPAQVGHALQVRVVEDANSTSRDAYIDSFSVSAQVVPEPEPPGQLYPQGDIFSFTFYSTRPADARFTVTNGATAIGPYYSGQYDGQAVPLSNAIAWNTKILYKVEPPSMVGASDPDVRDAPGFVWPSNTTISNEVAAIVNSVKTNAAIAMWDIAPEEMRYYVPEDVNYLRVVYAAIHANDSSNRPVYMYMQNNRTAAQLGVTMTNMDIMLKGTYVNSITDEAGVACFTNRIWARWSMKQAVDACKLYNTNAKPWIGLWMAADPPAGYTITSVTNWCRHDAYMGLIMGGKGIQIWSGFRGRAGFSDTYFDAYLGGYLSVANELNGPLKLAPVFLYGEQQTNVTMNITSGPATQHLEYAGTINNYPSITFSSLAHNGTNYLFMVNSAEQSVTATFSNVPVAVRTDLFTGTNAATPGGVFNITLPPLAVRAFQFASVSNIPPTFTTNLFVLSNATVGSAYAGTLASNATDPDPGDTLTFSKVSGPAWLNVATNGAFTGTPGFADYATNSFTVQVTDTFNASATATILINVLAPGCGSQLLWNENFTGETLTTLTNQGWTISGQTNNAELVASTANSAFLGTKSYLRVGSSVPNQPFGQKSFGPVTNGQFKAVAFTTSSFSNARLKLLNESGTALFVFNLNTPTALAVENITPAFSTNPMPNSASHNLLSSGGVGYTELTVTWGGSNVTWQAVNRNPTNGVVVYDTGRQAATFTQAGVPAQLRLDTGTYNATARQFGTADILLTDITGACFTNPPVILPGLNAAGGNFSFQFTGTIGRHYRVEFTPVLPVVGSWLVITDIVSLATSPFAVSSPMTNSQGFYRVSLIP